MSSSFPGPFRAGKKSCVEERVMKKLCWREGDEKVVSARTKSYEEDDSVPRCKLSRYCIVILQVWTLANTASKKCCKIA